MVDDVASVQRPLHILQVRIREMNSVRCRGCCAAGGRAGAHRSQHARHVLPKEIKMPTGATHLRAYTSRTIGPRPLVQCSLGSLGTGTYKRATALPCRSGRPRRSASPCSAYSRETPLVVQPPSRRRGPTQLLVRTVRCAWQDRRSATWCACRAHCTSARRAADLTLSARLVNRFVQAHVCH